MTSQIKTTIKFALSLAVAAAILAPVFAHAKDAAPFSPSDISSKEPHSALILEHGLTALEARLKMIERAKESIDLEYFIFNADRAGRLVLQALARKTAENPNLKVRILIDSSPSVLTMGTAFRQEMVKHRIELRFFNPATFLHIVQTQYRNHRKAIIVDGKEMITGGRNIAEEYFDLSPEYNFIDRDLWISGPIVAGVKKTFDDFWVSEMTKTVPAKLHKVKGFEDPESLRAAAAFEENDEDRSIRKQVQELAAELGKLHPEFAGSCVEPRFVTDEPGINWGHNAVSEHRKLRNAIISRIDAVPGGETILVESPYFLLKETGEAVLDRVVKRGVKGVLLTNSLGSTDAFYVAAVFNAAAGNHAQKLGVKLSIYDGKKPLKDTLYVKDLRGEPIAGKSLWGTHAKTFAFDEKSLMIGTFNIDPRSSNLNSEMAIFCENSPELTKALRTSIDERLANGHLLGKNGLPVDGKVDLLEGASTKKKIMYFLVKYPARLLSFLL